MQDAMEGARRGSFARRLIGLTIAVPLVGCAAIGEDVDAYYRQMAVNYQEAIAKAESDKVSLEHQARVLAATGDQSKLKKYRREIEHIKSWEEHCAWEQKRFEKAAEWMESHFPIDKKKDVAGSHPKSGEKLLPAEPDEPEDTRGHNIKDDLPG